MDPNYFWMPIPDPHHEKPGADPHQSQKGGSGPYQIKIKELLRAQNGAMEGR
jgi:hypothetical protein